MASTLAARIERAVDPHGAFWVETDNRESPLCPICCDSVLDECELIEPVCACGYQLCSFCLNKIQTEGDCICPNCRTSYESTAQEGLLAHLTELAQHRQQQGPSSPIRKGFPPTSPRGAAGKTHQLAGNGHTVLEVRRGATKPTPPSPGRNLGIDQEHIWPGLSPQASQNVQGHASISSRAHHRPPPPLMPNFTDATNSPRKFQGTGSVASTAPTTSGTPPSPVSTVMVSYHGNAPSVHGLEGLAAQGECAVLLRTVQTPRSDHIDDAGAALVCGLQEAVKIGRISAQQAASAIIQHLNNSTTAMPPPQARSSTDSMRPIALASSSTQQQQQHIHRGGAGLFDGWSMGTLPNSVGTENPQSLMQTTAASQHASQFGGGGGAAAAGAYRGPPPGMAPSRPPPPGFSGALAEQEHARSVFLTGGRSIFP